MKRIAAVSFILAIVLAGGLVYLSVQAIADHGIDATKADTPATCSTKGKDHLVSVSGNTVLPNHTNARLCDTLTITNNDDQIRLIAFGEHDNHQAYNGVLERTLQKGQNLTLTLNKTGTYKFHDHLDGTIQGTFAVSR